jgi:DNA-binding transcriptional LysR family regulator
MLQALEVFLSVATSANFSKAARSLDVAVSSVTRRIDGLEAELGAKLFNRGPRHLTLTDAGEALLPRARHILSEVAETKSAVLSLKAEPQGVLTITAPSSFGSRHVAPAAANFLKRYPKIEIDLHVSNEIVDLSNERVDVAIRVGVLPNSDLLATNLAPQRRIAVASPEYLAQHGSPKHPEDLLQHQCLTLRSRPSRVGWWCFAGVNRGKPLAVRGPLRSDDIDALLGAALQGLGIAHLASWLVGADLLAGRLVPLFKTELIKPPVTASAIHAVRFPGRSVAKSMLFIEHLRTSFGVANGGLPIWERRIASHVK